MTSLDWEPSDKTLERIRTSGTWGEYRRGESWRDAAARVVAAFGVSVVWSAKPLRIGETIWPGTSNCAEKVADQPFVVVGEATEDHFNRQLSFLGFPRKVVSTSYFYFVQTD
jgi:hypothetical protein